MDEERRRLSDKSRNLLSEAQHSDHETLRNVFEANLKAVGESIAQGRLFSPNLTLEKHPQLSSEYDASMENMGELLPEFGTMTRDDAKPPYGAFKIKKWVEFAIELREHARLVLGSIMDNLVKIAKKEIPGRLTAFCNELLAPDVYTSINDVPDWFIQQHIIESYVFKMTPIAINRISKSNYPSVERIVTEARTLLDAAYYRQGKDPDYEIPSVEKIATEIQVKLQSRNTTNKIPPAQNQEKVKTPSKKTSKAKVENTLSQKIDTILQSGSIEQIRNDLITFCASTKAEGLDAVVQAFNDALESKIPTESYKLYAACFRIKNDDNPASGVAKSLVSKLIGNKEVHVSEQARQALKKLQQNIEKRQWNTSYFGIFGAPKVKFSEDNVQHVPSHVHKMLQKINEYRRSEIDHPTLVFDYQDALSEVVKLNLMARAKIITPFRRDDTSDFYDKMLFENLKLDAKEILKLISLNIWKEYEDEFKGLYGDDTQGLPSNIKEIDDYIKGGTQKEPEEILLTVLNKAMNTADFPSDFYGKITKDVWRFKAPEVAPTVAQEVVNIPKQ